MSNFENKIKVADLRIGDYVITTDNNQVCKITAINELLGVEVNNNFIAPLKIEDIEPIPLTEDWLLKLGFSSEEYREKSKHIGINFGQTDFTLVKPGSSGFEHIKHFGFEFDAGGWPRLKQFEYVHELQNFFYCYSGEELEVKI